MCEPSGRSGWSERGVFREHCKCAKQTDDEHIHEEQDRSTPYRRDRRESRDCSAHARNQGRHLASLDEKKNSKKATTDVYKNWPDKERTLPTRYRFEMISA